MRVLHKSAGPVGNLYLLPAGRCALRLTFSTVQVQSPEVAFYLHYAALVLVLVRAPLIVESAKYVNVEHSGVILVYARGM